MRGDYVDNWLQSWWCNKYVSCICYNCMEIEFKKLLIEKRNWFRIKKNILKKNTIYEVGNKETIIS